MELTVPCGRQTCHKSDNRSGRAVLGPSGSCREDLAQFEGQENFLKEEASELSLQVQIGVCPLCSGLSHVSLWSAGDAFSGEK